MKRKENGFKTCMALLLSLTLCVPGAAYTSAAQTAEAEEEKQEIASADAIWEAETAETVDVAEESIPSYQASQSSTDTPDPDVWLADTTLYGFENSGNGNYSTLQSLEDPVYYQLGEYLLDDAPLVTISTAWSVYFNSEYRNHFMNEQKYIYEVLIMEYLKYDAESEGTAEYLVDNKVKYATKIYSMISNELNDNAMDYLDGSMSVEEATKQFNSISINSKWSEAVGIAQKVCDTSKDLIDAIATCEVLQEEKDNQIALLKNARDACAAYDSPNQYFIDAANEIITLMESEDMEAEYMTGFTLSESWNMLLNELWGELTKSNPALAGIDLAASGMDVLFNTNEAASNNLKLALLYTMDNYMKQGMNNAKSTYTNSSSDATAAQNFTSCFKGYVTFQQWADNWAASNWLEDYLKTDSLSGLVNYIFCRNNVETAEELIERCKTQIHTRENILTITDTYADMYQSMYGNQEFIDKLEGTSNEVAVESIALSQSDACYLDDLYFAALTVNPSNASSYSVSYSSSDDSVVSISQTGMGTIHQAGTATVTVTVVDNVSGQTFQDAKTVTILEENRNVTVEHEGIWRSNLNLKWKLYSNGLLYISGTGEVTYGGESWHWDDQIKKLVLDDGVTSIGVGAFSGCSSLTNVTIPNSVMSIGERAFSDCSSLASVTIPNSVTSIGNCAFSGCSSLASVTIPNSVMSIGERAFRGCGSLASVTIPNSVTSIGDCAFYDCSSLTDVTIPNSVTSIGVSAFLGCSSLTSVTIPDSVTSIGDCAFYDCSSLTDVTISNSVTSIGEMVFSDCSSLTNVTIPNSVISIGFGAFRGCGSLTSVTIPDSVTTIGNETFNECYNLKDIYYSGTEGQWWAITKGYSQGLMNATIHFNSTGPDDGYVVELTSTGAAIKDYIGTATSVVLPTDIEGETVTTIGANAFANTAVETVVIPNTVTTIEENAFANCTNLTSITIPDSVTEIGEDAFTGCDNVTICCSLNSVAYQYAMKCGIAVSLLAEAAYGDLDGSSAVDASDALTVLRAVVKLTDLSDAQTTAADVNGDGKVEAADALLILQKVVKLIDTFPVETAAQ